MSELERLMSEKRRLEDKIRLLKQGLVNFKQFDSIRFLQKEDADDGRERQVSSLMKQTHREYETREEARENGHECRKVTKEYEIDRWQVFIRENTKKDLIEKICQIITDLNAVLTLLEYEEDDHG